MIRVLHTGDWHIGQTLRGYSREYEHAHVLKQLVKIVAEQQVDVLIVAGDIFDSQNPSGESQSLFFETIESLHRARPEMATIIIAGNHDAAGRLEAPHPLLARFKVHVVGSVRRVDGRVLTRPPSSCLEGCIRGDFSTRAGRVVSDGDLPAQPDSSGI